MRPWLLVPVRSFAQGKRRLAGCMDTDQRRELNRTFLDHVLHQAAAWPGLTTTVVVSPCSEVLDHARARGARVLRQPALPQLDEATSETLNAALAMARTHLCRLRSRPLMVVPSDLPHLTARDLQQLQEAGRDGRVVVATDLHGSGTNGLYLPRAVAAHFPFCFGTDSARRHAQAARWIGREAAQLALPRLAFDIDTPSDLAALHAPQAAFA